MVIAGLVLTVLAALIHVYIFYLESMAWTGATARAMFGMTAAEAEVTKVLAFNQGFYNLFLAIVALAGVGFFAAGSPIVGSTLVCAGAGSMAGAAAVLGISSPSKRGAALKQGLLPALGVIALIIGLTM